MIAPLSLVCIVSGLVSGKLGLDREYYRQKGIFMSLHSNLIEKLVHK